MEGSEFWVHDGVILHTLQELVNWIHTALPGSFRYHVNKDNNKNDFADWIRTSFTEEELAMKLEGEMNQKKYEKILNRWIKKYCQ